MIKTTQDIHPVSKFKAHIAEHLKRIAETGRPELLTVNGEVAGVVLSPRAYDELMEEVELARSLSVLDRSMIDVKKGKGRPLREAVREIADELGLKLDR